ncbi:uncharacterized protein LOC144373079 isoform X2 [Ictidomys tridecemlineatus]
MKVATCRIEEETGEDKNWALQDLAADDWEDPRATQMAVGHTRTGCRESFSFVAATIEEAPCPMDPARLLLCGSCEDPPGALPPAPPQPGGLLPKNQPLPCWPDLLSSEHPQGPSYTASSFPQSKWVMLSVGSCFSLLGDLSALRLPIRPWSLKVSMIWTHGPIALRWSLEVGRRRATGSRETVSPGGPQEDRDCHEGVCLAVGSSWHSRERSLQGDTAAAPGRTRDQGDFATRVAQPRASQTSVAAMPTLPCPPCHAHLWSHGGCGGELATWATTGVSLDWCGVFTLLTKRTIVKLGQMFQEVRLTSLRGVPGSFSWGAEMVLGLQVALLFD